jgi:glyoxylase-like metal-dependent hydrolase (beta-lactamase superfamily II)
MRSEVTSFFHAPTYTVTHLVNDPDRGHCVIIDSVLDFDQKSGRTDTKAADDIIAHVQDQKLVVDWILETHVHADHLSAAPYLQEILGGNVAIGNQVSQVQDVFSKIYNFGDDFLADGSDFNALLGDGETIQAGDMTVSVLHTPGHTPACVTYLIGDAAFVGDTLFMPDFGTARTDFPGGDAPTLYRSIKRILSLPDETRIFTGHDYAPGGRDYAWESNVQEQNQSNVHIKADVSEDDFVQMRTDRDATLEIPSLILPSVQVNIRAGHMPQPEDNGVVYLKVPINHF